MNHLGPDRLVPYLDGELPAEEMARCQSHLRTCEVCRREAERLSGVWDLLDAAPRPEVPETLVPAVLARATEERAAAVRPGRRRSWWRIAGPVGIAAAVAWMALYGPGVSTRERTITLPRAPLAGNVPVTESLDPGEIEMILENREVLDVMNEYPDLIEHYDVLRALDRLLQDEHATS